MKQYGYKEVIEYPIDYDKNLEITYISKLEEDSSHIYVYYDKKLKDETTLGEFLTASSMETLLRVLFLLPKKELEVFNKNIAQLKEELTKIKNARNYVAHGQVLIFNEKFNLKEMIVLMLKYMPTKESKLKRIDELDKLNKRLFEEECKLPDILRESVSIVLKKKELEEIGL